jgi:hypothetical protein
MNDQKQRTYTYPLFTWILTILIAPLFLVFISIINFGFRNNSILEILEIFEVLPVFFILGGLYSLPTLLVFLINYYFLTQRNVSDLLIRSISMFMVNLCIYLTFLFIGGSESMKLTLVYGITMTILVWIVKIKQHNKTL